MHGPGITLPVLLNQDPVVLSSLFGVNCAFKSGGWRRMGGLLHEKKVKRTLNNCASPFGL